MCLWCYHHILEEAGKESLPARCPNCRVIYDQNKIQIQHIDAQMLAEEKRKLKCKDKGRASLAKSRAGLANVRVVQPNLVYVVGLPLELCHEEVLRQGEHFGRFGRIVKVSVNRASGAHSTAKHGATGSAYVTFHEAEAALRCMQGLDGTSWRGRPVRACFGTTKYCNAFLRGAGCTNPDCLYLHEVADESDCLTKEEVAAGLLPARFAALGASNTFRPRAGPAPAPRAGAGAVPRVPSLPSLPTRAGAEGPAVIEVPRRQPVAPPPPPPPPPPPVEPPEPQPPEADDGVEAASSTPFEHEFPSLAPGAETGPPPAPQPLRQWAAAAASEPAGPGPGAASAAAPRRGRGQRGPAPEAQPARAKKLVPLTSPGRIKPLGPPAVARAPAEAPAPAVAAPPAPRPPEADASSSAAAATTSARPPAVAQPALPTQRTGQPLAPLAPPGFESWEPMRHGGAAPMRASQAVPGMDARLSAAPPGMDARSALVPPGMGARSPLQPPGMDARMGVPPAPGYIAPPPGMFGPLAPPPGISGSHVPADRMQSRFAFAQDGPLNPPAGQAGLLRPDSGMVLLQQLRAASALVGEAPGARAPPQFRAPPGTAAGPPPGFDLQL